MKIKVLFLLLSLGLVSASDLAAPSFQLMNQNGENIELDSFKGKKVILEWTNHDCPFVQRHYETSNMQSLQEKYTEQGVVWLSIISSAEGKQGYISPDEAIQLTDSRGANPTHVLFDTSGEVGKMYMAKTTPHMYIIDENQKLQYQGAIDNMGGTSALFNTDLSQAKNYVVAAMNDLDNGLSVQEAKTRPYGCSIKY
jgi:peroxiredoxin